MLELIVFGKGYGESILVHIKDKWIVVDSFIEPKSHVPIAIKYLTDNGYDIESIVGIICTHWDNDHVVGLSQIINQHNGNIAICLPIIFTNKRFTEYLLFNSDNNIDSTSEFLKVLQLIKTKKPNILYAIAGRNLFEKEINDTEICLKTLSPNDSQYTAFLNSISLPEKGQVKRYIPLEENKISVVTYIKTCIDTILLGGDMENSPNGWDSICNSFIDSKCHVFKIPHHGSKTGYNTNVWKSLVDRPISIITRYNPSNLPTDEMVESIAKESSAVYVVGPISKNDRNTINQVKKYDNFGTIISVSMLDSGYGYVKLSKMPEDKDWSIETYGEVKKYSSI